MVSIRKKRGYLWGEEQLKYADPLYYDLALGSDDIKDEERFYQQVFHSKSHSIELTKEIFQKKFRNNVSSFNISTNILSTLDHNIINNVKSQEYKLKLAYSIVADESKTNEYKPHLQDKLTSIFYLVKDICKLCNEYELKVLAYIIVRENLDAILIDFCNFELELPELNTQIHAIWENNVDSIGKLNEFIGSKHYSDNARHTLVMKIRKRYPNFLN